MAKSKPAEPEEPLYIRWIPDTCPYALEMRLDLITRLKVDLDQAELEGLEIGGVFFGALPTQEIPTLRLDDMIIVPGAATLGRRKGADEFTLDASQVKHLAEMSSESRTTNRPFVGFFRSHLRNGPMEPSPADKAILTPQFPDGLYAFLMIGRHMSRSREAAFYLALGGQLSGVPSSSPFAFDESTFQSHKEIPAEAIEEHHSSHTRSSAPTPMPWPAILSLALVLVMICTWTLGGYISQFFRPSSNQIDLVVLKAGKNLKITWDHSAPVLRSSSGATMVIMDGAIHRELKLDTDDLRLGQVSYEHAAGKVYVVVSLDGNKTKLPPQTFDWNSN